MRERIAVTLAVVAASAAVAVAGSPRLAMVAAAAALALTVAGLRRWPLVLLLVILAATVAGLHVDRNHTSAAALERTR